MAPLLVSIFAMSLPSPLRSLVASASEKTPFNGSPLLGLVGTGGGSVAATAFTALALPPAPLLAFGAAAGMVVLVVSEWIGSGGDSRVQAKRLSAATGNEREWRKFMVLLLAFFT